MSAITDPEPLGPQNKKARFRGLHCLLNLPPYVGSLWADGSWNTATH
ncbi:hypothetical protein [Xylophilus sp. ASV27]|nr:hypothetical protein [Xylophilus sp. ASV27]